MRTLEILAFLLAAVSLSVLDERGFYLQRAETYLDDHRGLQLKYLGEGLVKVLYPDGSQMTWNLNTIPEHLNKKSPKKVI